LSMARARLIGADLAAELQGLPMMWHTVRTRKDGTANAARAVATRLRRSLPVWYGGEWEVSARRGELAARYVGEAA
jgi:hypothetical protein